MNCNHGYDIRPQDQLTANVIIWTCRYCGDQRLQVNTGPRIESDAVWNSQMRERDLANYYMERRDNA